MRRFFKFLFLLPGMLSAMSPVQKIECKTGEFPKNIGSTLTLSVDTKRNLVLSRDVRMTIGNYQTANYQVFKSTDEIGSVVYYLNWMSGGYSSEHSDLGVILHNNMVLHGFKEHLQEDRVMLGVIQWVEDRKVEEMYLYTCSWL